MDSIPNYSYDLLIYSKSYNKSSLEFITLQLKKINSLTKQRFKKKKQLNLR